ncbi:MAG: HAMP domain-containing sensor histidine kinase [Xenococcaceae cyanobacterium MO_188.B32]|nr:HAMP domain-containing sensor histidine kinase [Xenococcaceae cyanobacterium MO_188.B32]
MVEVFQIVITNDGEKNESSLNNLLQKAGIKAQIVKTGYERQQITALEQQIAIHKQNLQENQELIAILQDIIQQQQREIQIVEQLKARLLRIVSHELRNPLNLILGYSQLMLRQHYGHLNRQQLSIVEKVLLGGRNLLKSIDKMLDLSQLEANCLPLQIEQFNLIYLVEEVIQELLPQAEKKQLKLQVNCELQDPLIRSDRLRLRQILTNLVENGIKFTEQGAVQLAVTEVTKNRIIIKVKDTGIGIPAPLIAQIFAKFWQADQSLQRQNQGLGLGLALVKNLVAMMQGRITVESQLDQGSTFTISLPRQLTNNHQPSTDE